MLFFLGFVGPIIWSGPIQGGIFPRYQEPSIEFPLGTDAMGKNIFTLLLVSIRESLIIGILGGTLTFLIGIIVGLVAGYDSGIIGEFLTSVANLVLIIPTWPILVILASSVYKMTIPMMALIIAAFGWSWSARSIRSQVKSLKEQGFIEVARANGENFPEILLEEITPNMFSFLSVVWVRMITSAVIAEVGLEIIGLGPQGTTTLGLMIYWCQYYGALALGAWWWIMPPVICLVSIFVSLQMLTFGLDSIFNPRLRT
jgi:peptide/nickel transport system permease protein